MIPKTFRAINRHHHRERDLPLLKGAFTQEPLTKCPDKAHQPRRLHNNPLWPLHVWLRKTISSDIIDVTDVIVIKLSACEGLLCQGAVWWSIAKVTARRCSAEAVHGNAQVSASRAGGTYRRVHLIHPVERVHPPWEEGKKCVCAVCLTSQIQIWTILIYSIIFNWFIYRKNGPLVSKSSTYKKKAYILNQYINNYNLLSPDK